MSTRAVFVPFDLFGSAGAGAGAQLLADALREILADNRREKVPSRCHSYQKHVKIEELKFEKFSEYESWHPRARNKASAALRKNEFLIWIGGNHMSVLPVLEELGAEPECLVIQFDAHLDVYNLTDCATVPSHGNFLLHARGPLPPVIHLGHRDLFLPNDHIRKHFRQTFAATELEQSPQKVQRFLRAAAGKAKRVWIDIDSDVFDPAFFPAVGQPQPFGLAPAAVLGLIDAVWSERVAGVSISEFDPARDRNDQSLGTLVWLMEKLLLKRYENA